MLRSICDLSDDHPGEARAAAPIFRDFGGIKSFRGPITTLQCFEDNALLKATLSTDGGGRVMVVDGGASLRCALVGDKLGALMLHHGWAGIVVNGAARDVENLRDMPVAVRALAACPTRPRQHGGGERDIAVTFAGITFVPGEYLYADENGLIVSARPLV